MLGAGNEESQHQMLEQTTKNGRQSRVRIQFLAARARLFPAKQTKKEPACSVAEQAGVPIDRVFGLSIDRQGLFYLLTLESIGFVSAEDVYLAVMNNLCTLYIVPLYFFYALLANR